VSLARTQALLFAMDAARENMARMHAAAARRHVLACRCGCEFPAHLGKYGCPNCDGSAGAAMEKEATNDQK